MNLQATVETFKNGLQELEEMVGKAEQEVVQDVHAIKLVADNINFFTKSFLISACAHLEMCVKEVVYEIARDIDERLSVAAIPPSILEWRYGVKKKAVSPAGVDNNFSVGMTRKEIDDLVSGNVFRTKDALGLVGVDLGADKERWESWKELIQAIVSRRNNIVHHNDDASDLSLGDVRGYINSMIEYIDFIFDACSSNK